MTAAQLLKQFKTLPRTERQKFVKAATRLEAKELPKKKRKLGKVRWPDIEARAKRIFGDRIFPNLVLLERSEEPY